MLLEMNFVKVHHLHMVQILSISMRLCMWPWVAVFEYSFKAKAIDSKALHTIAYLFLNWYGCMLFMLTCFSDDAANRYFYCRTHVIFIIIFAFFVCLVICAYPLIHCLVFLTIWKSFVYGIWKIYRNLTKQKP